MKTKAKNQEKISIFSSNYWKDAASQLKDVKMLTIAALIVALRIVVKFIKIPLAPGLSISLDAYVNSLGSVVYGPVVGLVVGAISDVLGCVVTGQMGEYFLPFILVEMMSSFIFGLFFWRRKISLSRAVLAKFTVNSVCNILMTSVFMKWMYYIYYGIERADAYNVINGVRIVKNLIMFPLEATIIVIVLTSALPVLARLGVVEKKYCLVDKPSNRALATQTILLVVASVIFLLYLYVFKDSVADLNIKFW